MTDFPRIGLKAEFVFRGGPDPAEDISQLRAMPRIGGAASGVAGHGPDRALGLDG